MIENIASNKVHSVYGNINKSSANEMYRRYVKQVNQIHQGAKKPLSFIKWLEWAKKNEVLNGTFKQAGGEDEETKIYASKIPSTTGRSIAVMVLLISVFGLGFNIFR